MPTYEYQCDACGHQFEKFQSITAAPIKKCPKCGKSKVKRLISAGGGLIFKGSGFYITDYRDKGYQDKAKADTASSTPAASSDNKSESKPAASSETKTPSTASESKPAAAPAKTESKSTRSDSSKSKKK